jgi:8-oxo-dGTP diphosphatase/2-hydroxy-dATP diphosphatase
MKKVYTLCYVCEPSRILLGMKKVRFGKGKWNGFGGHVEEGESIEVAARRELTEECGLVAKDLVKLGVAQFLYADEDAGEKEVHIFRTDSFDGDLVESDEMTPKWFSLDEIPYHAMWPSDKYWFPLLLAKKQFTTRVVFDEKFSIVEATATEL